MSRRSALIPVLLLLSALSGCTVSASAGRCIGTAIASDPAQNPAPATAEPDSGETPEPQTDRIPMVMVNDTLYLDTGKRSSLQSRCGVMDGRIDSEVPGSETPTQNNQSNFGTGFCYQFGPQEGTIEILIDDSWWVYATQAVRQAETASSVVTVTNVFTGACCTLSEADSTTLRELLERGQWHTGSLTQCLNNLEVTVDGTTFLYHSDCGTWNHGETADSLVLSAEEKQTVNRLFSSCLSPETAPQSQKKAEAGQAQSSQTPELSDRRNALSEPASNGRQQIFWHVSDPV